MMGLLAASLVLGVVTAPQDVPADRLTLSAPAKVTTIDTGKIKGDPYRLAWSPDGRTLYLRVRKAGRGAWVSRYYAVSVEGGRLQTLEGEPAWAADYWTRKSARTAPIDPSVQIDVDQTKEHIQGGPEVLSGGMARSGLTGQGSITDPTPQMSDLAERGAHGQDVVVNTLRLKGEVVGAGEQGKIYPGQTFGWAPDSPGDLIVFADKSGTITVMDLEKRKWTVEASKDSTLPAWSDDGARIAYLQKTGKKTYDLLIVDVRDEGAR